MFIKTEQTPNPHVMKFLPGRTVLDAGTADYPDPARAEGSPLALRLFDLPGVAGVFLGPDFLSVTKMPGARWESLKVPVLSVLADHFVAGLPIVAHMPPPSAGAADDDDPVTRKIKDVLDERIRPAVARDGGDIVFDRFEDGIVYLYMRGACAGCPAAHMTLKVGVERLLKEAVPAVLDVRAINDAP